MNLTADEALVLFACLSRWSDADQEETSVPLAHPAEKWAMESLLAALEKHLAAPLGQDYEAKLETARAQILNQYGESDA